MVFNIWSIVALFAQEPPLLLETASPLTPEEEQASPLTPEDEQASPLTPEPETQLDFRLPAVFPDQRQYVHFESPGTYYIGARMYDLVSCELLHQRHKRRNNIEMPGVCANDFRHLSVMEPIMKSSLSTTTPAQQQVHVQWGHGQTDRQTGLRLATSASACTL